jgi:hypothetical protein
MPHGIEGLFFSCTRGERLSPGPGACGVPLHEKENAMKRDLKIRCVAKGTVRADSPDGGSWLLRDVWLDVAGTAAHVRMLESSDGADRTVERAIRIGEFCVRCHSGYGPDSESASTPTPFGWLFLFAESMQEGECREASFWVRSADLAALVYAVPVSEGSFDSCCAREERAGHRPHVGAAVRPPVKLATATL